MFKMKYVSQEEFDGFYHGNVNHEPPKKESKMILLHLVEWVRERLAPKLSEKERQLVDRIKQGPNVNGLTWDPESFKRIVDRDTVIRNCYIQGNSIPRRDQDVDDVDSTGIESE